jgi:hypothetical protein
MDELPFHYPQLCKQWAIELGDPELPRQVGAFLAALAPTAGERRATGRKNPIRRRSLTSQFFAAQAASESERTVWVIILSLNVMGPLYLAQPAGRTVRRRR